MRLQKGSSQASGKWHIVRSVCRGVAFLSWGVGNNWLV